MGKATCTVERDLLLQINNLLVDAYGNSAVLLQEHENSLGRTTKKNRITAEMYEKEISDIDEAIGKVKQIIR